jgi:hypothetical protein
MTDYFLQARATRLMNGSNIEMVRTRGTAGRITSIIVYRCRILGGSQWIGSAEYSAGNNCGTWYVRCCGAETRHRHDPAKTADENLSAVELIIMLQVSAADASEQRASEMARFASAGALSAMEIA